MQRETASTASADVEVENQPPPADVTMQQLRGHDTRPAKEAHLCGVGDVRRRLRFRMWGAEKRQDTDKQLENAEASGTKER
ncbi:unnamed protein product [Vitrella brassicaformis CCMP3155]|uniref:Uncharacterized protein n=1 Tax=Vitrella brassicaformis (strain CCMP3155) TaxID=1169540 RepID=A0A0G4H6B2_VITBC|nr:unnamed protein product [Vitrella brassicaformis CCMP3155]|eukprot:CEM39372.1 unnamed protein product [Vitrella brassicaformis CCMP3155]